jgi:hypothetical protein
MYAEVLKRSMVSGGAGRERSQEDDMEQANRGRQSNSSAGHNTGPGANSRGRFTSGTSLNVNNGIGFKHGASHEQRRPFHGRCTI